MEFDKNRVYSAANADAVKIGSIGYFADTLASLKEQVRLENKGSMHALKCISSETDTYRFSFGAVQWSLFYLLKETEEDLCTQRELSYWLTKGNGEYKFVNDDVASTSYTYNVEYEDSPVQEFTYEVRRWGDKKWHTPTREYMGFV